VSFDPSVLSWKDWFLLGVVVAMWFNARARRAQGERLGTVEKAIVAIAKTAGVELDEDSDPGKPKRRK
jgi:hypothetical protein